MDLFNFVLDPRVARRLMSQTRRLELDPPAGAAARGRRRIGGAPRFAAVARLLLANPKSRVGLAIVRGDGRARRARTADRSATGNDFSLLDRGRRRRGTTSSGRPTRGATSSRRSSWGARRSLLLGALPALLATVIATILGIFAAYARRLRRRGHQPHHERLLRHPDDPAADRRHRVPAQARAVDDDPHHRLDALGVRGAHPARPGADAANRDFMLAAKVAGESTWRIVFGELMPNMVSRIAAAFVLVFYIAILVDAGLEFLGLGDMEQAELGRRRSTGRRSTRACSRASGGRSSSPVSRSASPCSRCADPRRDRRGQQSAAAAAARKRRLLRRRSAERDVTASAEPWRPRASTPARAEPLVELRGLAVEYGVGERRARRRRHRPRRSTPARSSGSPASPGCGKSTIANAVMQILRPPAQHHRRQHPVPGRRPRRQEPRGAPPLPLAQRLDGLPERDERAQPGDARRRPVRRHDAGARAHLEERVARARGRAARARRHRPAPRPLVPARALRRHAPARDHRDGARAPARAA